MMPSFISKDAARWHCRDFGKFCVAAGAFTCMIAGAFYALDMNAMCAATVALAGCWFGAAAGGFWLEQKM
jgi:hypothetical protein